MKTNTDMVEQKFFIFEWNTEGHWEFKGEQPALSAALAYHRYMNLITDGCKKTVGIAPNFLPGDLTVGRKFSDIVCQLYLTDTFSN